MLLIIITDSEKWEYSLFMSDLGQGCQAWNVARILNKEKENNKEGKLCGLLLILTWWLFWIVNFIQFLIPRESRSTKSFASCI